MADLSGVSQTNLELLLEFEDNLDDSSTNNRDQSSAIGAVTYVTDGAINKGGKFVWQHGTFIDTGVESVGSCDLFCTSGQSFTVAVWVRFRNQSSAGTGTIVGRQKGTGQEGIEQSTFFLHVLGNPAAPLLLRLRGQDNHYNVTMHDGGWHLIVFTWNGTTPVLYFDDVVQTTPQVGSVVEQPVNIYIGGSDLDDAPDRSSHFTGQMDDLRFYSRALSASEAHLLWIYGEGTSEGGDVQLDDLELWLEFEDDLLDSSVNLRHQTSNIVNGPLSFVTGKVNAKASAWTASSSQHIATGVQAFGDCTLFSDASNAFTVSVWVKNDDAGGGIGMVTSRQMGASPGPGFRLRVTNGGAEVYLRGQLSNYTLTGNDDGEWHHYAVTWDGSTTTAKFYYDGVAQSDPTNGSASEGTCNIYIGATPAVGCASSIGTFFDEHMDDLRFYSRALSASDITDLVNNSGLTQFSAALSFDSISGAVATIQATFGDSIVDLVSGDITVTNGTVSNIQGSGASWTFDVTAAADGVVTVSMASGVVANSDGATNLASNTLAYGVGSVSSEDGDGLQRFDRNATRDFTSEIIIGPVRISPTSDTKSIIRKAHAVFGSGTDATGTLAIAGGVDGEDATVIADNAAEHYSATIANVRANHGNIYPHVGGHAATFRLNVTAGHCVLEEIDLELADAGRNVAPRYVP